MSEVKYYWAGCPEFEGLTERVVLAADFDRVTADLLATQSHEGALLEDLDRVTAERDAALAELNTQTLRADAAVGDANEAEQKLSELRELHAKQTCVFCNDSGNLRAVNAELQQRLTAADELLDSTKAELAWQESDNAELRKRVEVLEGLLREVSESVTGRQFTFARIPADWFDRRDAALNPTADGELKPAEVRCNIPACDYRIDLDQN